MIIPNLESHGMYHQELRTLKHWVKSLLDLFSLIGYPAPLSAQSSSKEVSSPSPPLSGKSYAPLFIPLKAERLREDNRLSRTIDLMNYLN